MKFRVANIGSAMACGSTVCEQIIGPLLSTVVFLAVELEKYQVRCGYLYVQKSEAADIALR